MTATALWRVLLTPVAVVPATAQAAVLRMLARMARPRVILLPGSVLPAGLAYPALVDAVGDQADLRPKDLELYAADRPPSDYSLEHEAVGIERLAEDLGWERFHLVGYSGGGAAVLHFTATRLQPVLSLALLEPA